jgi:hypothetical protein
VAANTLIGLKKNDDSMALFEDKDIEALQEKLLIIRHRHFGARTAKQKINLREKDKRICDELIKELKQAHYYTNKDAIQMAEWNPYSQNKTSGFFDPYWMFGIKDGFDVVIGNPPYGADIDSFIKIFEELYPKTSHGFKDIYKYFFDKSISLTNSTGLLCFITPNTFLRQPRYGDLRRLLLEHSIIKLLDLGEDIFEAVVPTAISLISRQKNTFVNFADLTKLNDVKSALRSIEFILIEKNQYLETPNNIFVENIRKKLQNEHSLDDILEMKDAGINYQRVNVGLSDKGNSDLSKRLLYEGEKKNKNDIEFWKGTDINSYHIESTTNRFCHIGIKLNSNERVILNKEYFEIKPKLIWRQTAPFPVTAIDYRGIWFGRSIQAGIIKNKYKKQTSYEYLCGILNSKYIRYLYEQNVKEEGRVFPQVKLEKLKSLPVVISNDQEEIVSKVKAIISAKKSEVQANTIKLEKEIDQLVYKLYNLTAEEIAIVEGKNE